MFVNFSNLKLVSLNVKSNIILQICMRVRHNIVYADWLIAVTCQRICFSPHGPTSISIFIRSGEIIHIVS